VHFRPLLTFPWFREHGQQGRADTPVADQLASRVLSLPLHSALRPEQVDRVSDALYDALHP
jgi:dTDP-4-amino-4,6-dideoxygalactose transaminase